MGRREKKTVASHAVAPSSAATPATAARHSAGHQQRPAFRPSAPYRTWVYPRHNHDHGRRENFTRKPAHATSAPHRVENKLNIQHRAALDIDRHKPRGYIRSQLNRNSLHFFLHKQTFLISTSGAHAHSESGLFDGAAVLRLAFDGCVDNQNYFAEGFLPSELRRFTISRAII